MFDRGDSLQMQLCPSQTTGQRHDPDVCDDYVTVAHLGLTQTSCVCTVNERAAEVTQTSEAFTQFTPS